MPFSWLIAWLGPTEQGWTEMESRHPCFNILPLSMMLSVDVLLQMLFIKEFIFLFLYCGRVLNFVQCFSCNHWDACMGFLFYSVHRWIILIKFLMLTQTCLPGINPIWSWCISIFLFIHCWVQFANILIFISIFMRNIGLFSFLVIPFSGFVPHTVFLRSHLCKYHFITSLTNAKLNCSEVCFHGHWKVPKSHMKEVKTKRSSVWFCKHFTLSEQKAEKTQGENWDVR